MSGYHLCQHFLPAHGVTVTFSPCLFPSSQESIHSERPTSIYPCNQPAGLPAKVSRWCVRDTLGERGRGNNLPLAPDSMKADEDHLQLWMINKRMYQPRTHSPILSTSYFSLTRKSEDHGNGKWLSSVIFLHKHVPYRRGRNGRLQLHTPANADV